jgi:hypothetical protein
MSASYPDTWPVRSYRKGPESARREGNDKIDVPGPELPVSL